MLDGDAASGTEISPEPDDRYDVSSLLGRVRTTFPTLVISSFQLEKSGGDHVILVVNNDYAFRFPRLGMHDLGFEIEVLRHLRPRSPLAVPTYDYVDPAARFAAHRFIEGEALTGASFALLDDATRANILDAAAEFLIALHDIPQAEINWPLPWPKVWTAAQFADHGRSEHLPWIAHHAPHLAGPLEAFYSAFQQDRPESPTLIHGDLVCEHILIDRARSVLTGIIDFGDVALGDPAQDLLGFWSYGADAVARVIDRYDPRRSDPDLLRRSHNHFVRYRIDHLSECLADGVTPETSAHIATVEALLTSSAIFNRKSSNDAGPTRRRRGEAAH